MYVLFYHEIPNKWEVKQIAFENSSDTDFQDFLNFYKKLTAKPFLFLGSDNTLASDNLPRFRKKPIERI